MAGNIAHLLAEFDARWEAMQAAPGVYPHGWRPSKASMRAAPHTEAGLALVVADFDEAVAAV